MAWYHETLRRDMIQMVKFGLSKGCLVGWRTITVYLGVEFLQSKSSFESVYVY